jgi:3-oxoacyl-[acyl-carrier protein] reductase
VPTSGIVRCHRLIGTALEAFGAVDIVISNASIAFPFAPILELDWPDVSGKLTGELGSAFAICQAAKMTIPKSEAARITAKSSSDWICAW